MLRRVAVLDPSSQQQQQLQQLQQLLAAAPPPPYPYSRRHWLDWQCEAVVQYPKGSALFINVGVNETRDST
eukprot:COSAG01_NODE_53630_length_337_cov_4.869748_1_plen_71_part_00